MYQQTNQEGHQSIYASPTELNLNPPLTLHTVPRSPHHVFIPSRRMPTTLLPRHCLIERRFRITLQPLEFGFLARILGMCLRGGSTDVGVCRSPNLVVRLGFWLRGLAAGFRCWVRRHVLLLLVIVVYWG